jgi:site-specific DNA recombinase
VSTERQATEGLSLDEQVRQVEAHIETQRWQHVDTLIEAGVSGRRDDRPKLAEVMRLASDGRIDVLVIPKLDRLGRSTLHLLQVCADLKTAGVRFVSLGDSIDTSTAAGQMLLEILAAVASFESARIGERVASVTAARAASGKAHGRVPYGYRAGGKDGLLVDPAQAVIVRRVFHEHNAG